MTPHRKPIQHPAEIVNESDLIIAVREALYSQEALRQSKATIDVTVVDGIITLAGNVRTQTHVDFATAVAGRVAGVKAVRSALITDTDLENEVAIRLATDPRTRLTTDRVTLTALLGSVLLTGVVDSAAQKAAAMEITRGVPGVWEVVDALTV